MTFVELVVELERVIGLGQCEDMEGYMNTLGGLVGRYIRPWSDRAEAAEQRAADADESARMASDRVERLVASISTERTHVCQLREALEEIMPRYCELFTFAGLGNVEESVAVAIARAALAATETEPTAEKEGGE